MNTYDIQRIPYGHIIKLQKSGGNFWYVLSITTWIIAMLFIMLYVGFFIAMCALNASVYCIVLCGLIIKVAWILIKSYLFALFGTETLVIKNKQLYYVVGYKWFSKWHKLNFNQIELQSIIDYSNVEQYQAANLIVNFDGKTIKTRLQLPKPQINKIVKTINTYHNAA